MVGNGIKENLSALVQKLCAAPLENLTRLSGGASQESWVFTCNDEKFVLRRTPNGAPNPPDGTKLSMAGETAIIKTAFAAHIAVPEIVHLCTPQDGLGHGFIMRFIEGETVSRKILRDDAFAPIRPHLAAQAGRALAQIHKLTIDHIADIPFSDARGEINRYEAQLRAHGHPHPVFELAFTWLRAHIPTSRPTRLVHGDFRNGNFIITPENGIVSILDWELAHMGDPMEDVGWICVPSWRFGKIDAPVGGFGLREAFYKAYEAAGGQLDRHAARFWEILGTLKWGIMCTMMVDSYLSGTTRTVERAAIGRRASETEIDLLRMLLEQD